MSKNSPPDALTYAGGGGAGSRLEIRNEVRVTHRTRRDRIAHGLVGGVKAPVEADLKRHARRLDGRERAINLR
jgi:hypothetical protein